MLLFPLLCACAAARTPEPALQLWQCDNGTAAADDTGRRVGDPSDGRTHCQQFLLNKTAQSLKLATSELCLDRSGNHQFAALLLSPCDGSDGQLWLTNSSSSSVVVVQSQMPGSDFGCIGASAPVAAGTPLQLAPDCGTLLTEWQEVSAPAGGSEVHFRLKYSGLCMDHGSGNHSVTGETERV